MTRMIKSLVAISLSVMMALTLFPLIGGVAFSQTAFADDEIVQDDGAVGVDEVVNEEEPASEVQDDSVVKAPSKDGEEPEEPEDPIPDDAPICIDPQDWEHGMDLYSDGENKYNVYSEESEFSLQVRVGMGFEPIDNEGGMEDTEPFTIAMWESQFTGGLFTKGKDKDFTFSKGVLTLFGPAIYKKVKGTYDVITISAALVDNEGCVVTATESEVNIRAVVPDYSEMQAELCDMDLFQGESLYRIYRNDFEGYVENSKHPDGTFFKCTIYKMTSSKSTVVKVTNNSKKHYWTIKALKQGEATITVSFYGYKKKKTTHKFKVTVVGERVAMSSIEAVNGEWRGIPGESIDLSVDAWYENVDGLYDPNHISYEWSVVEDCQDYGEIAQDPDDPSKATLTFKYGEVLEEDEGYEVGVEVTATYTNDNGKVISAKEMTWDPQVMLDYNTFVSEPEMPKYMDVGQEVTITPHIEKHAYGQEPYYIDSVKDVEFYFESYDEDCMSVTDNHDGSFTIKRIKRAENGIYFEALWDYDPVEEEYNGEYETDFEFDEISNRLADYEIRYVGAPDYIYYVGPEGIDPEIQVVDWDTGYVLPEEYYTLEYKKVEWDEDYNETIIPWNPPLTYDYDPTKPWKDSSGYGNYRVYAKAADGSGFKGTTDKESGWLDVYSDHTLSGEASTVEIDSEKYGPYMVTNGRFEPGERYDLPFGFDVEASDFTVKVKGGTTEPLVPEVDYTIKYTPWFFDGDEPTMLDDFPITANAYDCSIVGLGDYYGINFSICFFVGEKNPAQIETKTGTVSYKKLKKKPQKTTAITVTDNVGDAWFYKGYGSSSKLSVSEKTGKITVKKNTKKGTYKANVTVLIDGDETYAPVIERVQVTIKVK